jgi:hypothetical protein
VRTDVTQRAALYELYLFRCLISGGLIVLGILFGKWYSFAFVLLGLLINVPLLIRPKVYGEDLWFCSGFRLARLPVDSVILGASRSWFFANWSRELSLLAIYDVRNGEVFRVSAVCHASPEDLLLSYVLPFYGQLGRPLRSVLLKGRRSFKRTLVGLPVGDGLVHGPAELATGRLVDSGTVTSHTGLSFVLVKVSDEETALVVKGGNLPNRIGFGAVLVLD